MPLPTITRTTRVAIEGTLPNGHKWANVLHFRRDNVLTENGAQALINSRLDNLFTVNIGTGTALRYFLSTGWRVDRYRMTPLDNISATSVWPKTHVGQETAQALPSNVAGVITLYTARRGRSYRGRFYLAGYTELSNQANGAPDVGIFDAQRKQVSEFLAALTGSGIMLVVASYKLSTAEDVVSVGMDYRWDTQRRRLNV